MIKSLMIASALCAFLAAPAFAGSGGCDDADAWNKNQADITAMPAGPEKDAAMAEWKMSGDFKASNKMEECNTHMKAALDHAGKGKKN